MRVTLSLLCVKYELDHVEYIRAVGIVLFNL